MKKYFFTSALLSSFLFVGCTPPMATTHFQKSSLYSNALQYTKKADIIFQDEVKVMMNITYLNEVNSKWNDKHENFIVGIYVVEDENNNGNDFLNNPDFQLTLNDRNYVSKELLTSEHDMYGKLPLYNVWAKYYVISFDKNKDDDMMELTLKHPIFGKMLLSFRSI